ncbi:hypothetical protein ABK905_00485 [Acerihabitans sp. KWT182]|uniref:Uncharacterized protein n=1 Tax=Acerihabitans sp. KWT182 TaxID=3157919 RepID=A0AAU7QCG9_9GAMM
MKHENEGIPASHGQLEQVKSQENNHPDNGVIIDDPALQSGFYGDGHAAKRQLSKNSILHEALSHEVK